MTFLQQAEPDGGTPSVDSAGVAVNGLSGPARGGRAAASAAMTGRWSALPSRSGDATRRALMRTELLIERYGVLTRGEVAAEQVPGGFAGVYPVLRQAEDAGRYRRGYFVDGLGAAQFGLTGAIDLLRSSATALESETTPARDALVLAATDPANPYGAALDWPDRAAEPDGRRGHQPARKSGSLVVLVDGRCVLYVERGGKTILTFGTDEADLYASTQALAVAVKNGALGTVHVQSADGATVIGTPLAQALEQAGFRPSPRGLVLRG